MKKNKKKNIKKKKSRNMKRKGGKIIEKHVILALSLSDNDKGTVIKVNGQTEKAGGSISFSVIDPVCFDLNPIESPFYFSEEVEIDIDHFFKNTKGKKYAQMLLHATLMIKANAIHSVNIHSVIKNLVASDEIIDSLSDQNQSLANG